VLRLCAHTVAPSVAPRAAPLRSYCCSICHTSCCASALILSLHLSHPRAAPLRSYCRYICYTSCCASALILSLHLSHPRAAPLRATLSHLCCASARHPVTPDLACRLTGLHAPARHPVTLPLLSACHATPLRAVITTAARYRVLPASASQRPCCSLRPSVCTPLILLSSHLPLRLSERQLSPPLAASFNVTPRRSTACHVTPRQFPSRPSSRSVPQLGNPVHHPCFHCGVFDIIAGKVTEPMSRSLG
jgi:hypothetical protein